MTDRLEARGLAGGYPGVTVFSGVDLSVGAGERLTILGGNGSGKSALLETLQGLLPCRHGTILLDGVRVEALPPEERAARGMSLVSDRRRLWREMKVSEHLRVGAYRAAARKGWRSRARELQGLFPSLAGRRGLRPGHLSGGLQQQLAIARFGMSSPAVWLLDDPLQGLDEPTTACVLDWIRAASGAGAAVVLTGQHVRKLLGLATRAMFLAEGTLSEIPAGPGGLDDARVRRLL